MTELSASKLTTYMDCPLKYKFRYVDKIEPESTPAGLAMGSAFHRTIKHFYNRLMDGQQLGFEELEAAFRQDWEVAQTVPIAWNGDGPEAIERQGIEMLRAYIENIGDLSTPLAVESRFQIPIINLVTGEKLKDVELVGVIDRIGPNEEPIEVKTSARSWSQSQADTSIQMTAYAYHLSLLTGCEQIDGRFEVMVKNKTPKLQIIKTVRTPHHFDQLFRSISAVARCIQEGVWYPNPGMFCSGCEFADECSAW